MPGKSRAALLLFGKAESMKTSAWLLPSCLAAAVGVLPACSSNKNHEERENTPEAQGVVDPSHPEIIDPVAQQVARKGECLQRARFCEPDPGSRQVDCEKQIGNYVYEWAWDITTENKARATYFYDDNTTSFLVPAKDMWEPVPDPVIEDPSLVCGLTHAVRFKGGPFTEYGGGFGQSFVTSANPAANMNLPPSPEFPGDGITELGAYDLRDWDGVALWVRRGPTGQASLRVGITERNSAEDLNVTWIEPGMTAPAHPEQESRYCERFRLCGCAAGTPCSPAPSGAATICWDPEADPDPYLADDGVTVVKPTVCGDYRCDEPNLSLVAGVSDARINDRSCNVAYTSDGLTASFCYNPGVDPNPPAKRERCGNPYSRPISTSTDWQLIRVPFSELRQAEEAYVADEIDLASVKQLIFTFTTGWIDFWVANVGFYRAP